ncbi:MAG: MFS transporter [Acidimicrobiales bacterium]|nr:MFS transporter [Acidimicrobiales bacterium]
MGPSLEGETAAVTRRRRLTLAAMCIAQGMTLLDITIVNTALPAIQRDLHMTPGRLEWVISAYALSLAAFIPLGGALGDRYGRKRFFVVGMVIFALGSTACALSTTDLSLIVSRAVQGVGGAVMSALTLSILTETFPPARRAGAIGAWAAIAGLGFGLGPVVGGILLSFADWSSVFWVNVPIAVIGLAVTVVAVEESRDTQARHLDVVGVALLAFGLLGITFGLIESSSHPWGDGLVVLPLTGGLMLVLAFLLWERHTPTPMLPSTLFRARSFTTGCVVYLLGYLALTGVMFYVTLLFQNVDGWSPLRTGVSWLSMNIPFLLTAQYAGGLSRRFPPWVVVSGGCAIGAISVGVLASVSDTTNFGVAFVGYVLLGVGWGAFVPATINVAMRDVPEGTSGGASGIVNAARQVGSSVGLAVLGAIGVNAASSAWARQTSSVADAGRQAQAVAGAEITAVTHALGADVRGAAVDAFLSGYRLAMLTAALCTLAAAVVAVFGLRHVPRVPPSAPPRARPAPEQDRAVDPVGSPAPAVD